MPQEKYREITVSAIILGLILGIFLTAAFTYVGMVIGFTIGGSAIAAILGWGILRGILRKGSIVENNINQTIASAINISSAGVIFIIPVLYLRGLQHELNFLIMAMACFAGAMLGVAFIIPLRKQMIDIDRLRFPTGMAVATILKSPGSGIEKTRLLIWGLIISAFVCFLTNTTTIPGKIDFGGIIHFPNYMQNIPDYMQNIWKISLFALGAGFITGRAGLIVLAGGLLSYWIITPIAITSGWVPSNITGVSGMIGHIHDKVTRPIGIGMLVGGAVLGILIAFPSIKAAFVSLHRASKLKGKQTSDELPIKFTYLAAVGAFVLLLVTTQLVSNYTFPQALLVAVVGTVWLWLAGIIVAQCTGMTDWSPISGLALIAVTLILFIGSKAVLPAVLIGTAVCLATGQCADMMQDLKTGFVVGAKPKRQQIIQICVTWIGPIVSLLVIGVLWEAYRFGPNTEITVPQAQALSATIDAVKGGDAPYTKYLAGAIIAGALGLSGIPGLGVLIGIAMYLPMLYILPYGLGCLIQMVLAKVKGKLWCEEKGVPLAAGLIVGEFCVVFILALLKIFGVY